MTDSQNISQQDWQQQESLIAQFEAAFQQGDSPRIEDYLLQEGTDRFLLFIELVHTDLEQRLKTGESTRLEEYLKRFPEISENSESFQELVVTEYVLRLRTESQIDVSEYAQRFPQLGDLLISKLNAVSKQEVSNHEKPAAHMETIIQSEDSTQSQIAEKSTIPPIDSPEQNEPLQQYGRYVVKKLLGAGAFGQVFLAHDPKTKRDVALKVPRRPLHPGSEEDERFLREARAVAALQHQHICPLFDLLETDDSVVLVMPYIEGGSLAEKIQQKSFKLEKSIQLVRILASAMAYAHKAGVVHRDLKPANILIDKKHSKPVITDFGLALRNDSDESTLTQKGQLLGTPAYMSPEQAGAENDKVSFTSDIYSLGMILYELCTGELPFTGSITQVIGQILTKEPTAPSSINPDISSSLEQIILKAIAKRPEDRFDSMKEFAAALEQLQPAGNRIETVESTFEVRKSTSLNKRWIVTGFIILLLVLGSWFFFGMNGNEMETNQSTENSSQKPGLASDATKNKSKVFSEDVNLIKEIQLPDDAFVGNWSMTDEGIVVTQEGFSRVMIPACPQGDFEVHLELTRKHGKSEVNLIFPVGKTDCMLSLGRRDDWCGLQHVNGRDDGKIVLNHLENGIKHCVILSVTIKNQQAVIKATVDGKPILDWQGPTSSLTLRNDWKLPKKNLGLGAHDDEVVFHDLRFLLTNR